MSQASHIALDGPRYSDFPSLPFKWIGKGANRFAREIFPSYTHSGWVHCSNYQFTFFRNTSIYVLGDALCHPSGKEGDASIGNRER